MRKQINPFDFWSGANFKLKIRKVEGYWNYDKSEFDSPSVLLDDDDKLESIYKNLNDLNEFTDLKNFKSYEDLKKRLDYVLGNRGVPKMQDQETVEEEQQWERERRGDFSESKSYNAPAASGGFNDSDITPQASTETTEEEDDALSYFQKLAES